MKLVKLLKALAKAAPSNDVRYYINTVYFERVNRDPKMSDTVNEGNCLYVIVTTGHYIIRARVDPKLVSHLEHNGESLLITRTSLLEALKNFKVGDDICIGSFGGDWCLLENNLDDWSTRKKLDVCGGRYPNWRRVWNNVGSSTAKIPDGIGVSANLLLEVSKVFQCLDTKLSPTLMTFGDTSDPIHFTYKGDATEPSIYALEARLCPCRL